MEMNEKDAIATAKNYVVDLYSDDKINDVGLEEIEFDDQSKRWLVTIGITRLTAANNFVTSLGGTPLRSYKLVAIDGETGRALSLKDREFSH